MTFKKYCEIINDLSKFECDFFASKTPGLFGYVHTPLPESMLQWYWDNNYSPCAALVEINEEAGV